MISSRYVIRVSRWQGTQITVIRNAHSAIAHIGSQSNYFLSLMRIIGNWIRFNCKLNEVWRTKDDGRLREKNKDTNYYVMGWRKPRKSQAGSKTSEMRQNGKNDVVSESRSCLTLGTPTRRSSQNQSLYFVNRRGSKLEPCGNDNFDSRVRIWENGPFSVVFKSPGAVPRRGGRQRKAYGSWLIFSSCADQVRRILIC